MKIDYCQLESTSLNKALKRMNISRPKEEGVYKSFFAYIDQEPIGCLLLNSLDNKGFFIITLMVIPMFRGEGIGSILLNKAFDFCKKINKSSLSLSCNTLNHDVKRFNKFLLQNQWEPIQYKYTKYKVKVDAFQKSFIDKFFYRDTSIKFEKCEILYLNQLTDLQIEEVRQTAISKDNFDLKIKERLKFMAKELSVFVVVDNVFIAWSIVQRERGKEMSLLHTYVDKSYRATGIGLKLWYLIFKKATSIQEYASISFISFIFDKRHSKLLKLYNMIFDNKIHSNIDYYFSSVSLAS